MISPKEAAGRFRAAVEARDADALMATFAERSVLHSPITFQPFEGKPAIRRLLAIILEVFEDMRYTDVLVADDGTTALVFRTRVAGRAIEGLDLLRFDEHGAVSDLTVMVRPRSGMEALLEQVGPRLAAAIAAAEGR